MVGQKNLLKIFKRLIDNNSFAKFTIIVGERGSEANKFAAEISKWLNANLVEVPDIKVDTIRNIITEAYKVSSTTIYNIKDADNMSLQARNSLLKVTEEPPNKSYFIMTVDNDANLIDTIKSRGAVFYTERYTRDEILEYYNFDKDTDIITALCDTPGEVDIIRNKPGEFYEYVEKVVDNIAAVSGSNAFKIAEKIKLKDTDEGYDLILFWKAFKQICFDKELFRASLTTSEFLNMVNIKSINKQMLFDSWILEMRRIMDNGDN